MDQNSIYTVLITAITVLGSSRAWSYYQRKAEMKEKSENFIMNDCRERIAKLEALLEKNASEKDTLRNEILSLTSKVSQLTTKVEFLEKENNDLLRYKEKK